MNSRIRWLMAFSLASLTIIAVIGSVKFSARARQTSTPQSVDNIDPETLAIMRRQEALQPAVTALYEAHMKSPGSGFTSVAFEGDGVSLHWKGPLTDDMSAAIDMAREAGPVQIKATEFSLAEMEIDAEKIIKYVEARGGSDIQSIAVRHDGSGLDVELMPADAVAKVASSRAKAGKSALWSAHRVLAGLNLRVPVHVATASERIEFKSSRLSDTPPWNGGGRFETWRGLDHRASCTTGFGVRNGAGRRFVLTAAHCGTTPDIAYQGVFFGGPGTSFTQMGPVHSDQWQYDLMLIDAPGFYRMFDGSPTTSNYKIVHGWGYHARDELLCHSGMTSGVVCGLKTGSSVPYLNVSCDAPDSDGDCNYSIRGLIRTTQVNGLTASRPGDSGGPVFSLMGSGVRAKGILSGGSPDSGATMYFQDWADVIRLFGCYPETN